MTIQAGTLVPRDARDFGSYQLIAKLATGGMAEIFLARATSPSAKDVLVLKRILPHLAEDDHFVTMFRDEAELASFLNHKNVCQVLGYGEFAGTWFIAMEYLHGVPLSRMMTRLSKAGRMLDLRVVAGIIVQACEGLHAAHEAHGPDGQMLNVVHRDVSPPNIMVCADGTVKVLDFGIAKARGANSRTRTGTVKGKNAYMSPEQILGKPLDRRSDVFALAIVMYEMLAIKRLFHRDSDFLTFKAITEEPIPEIKDRRPDIPPAMRAALLQGMARDPNGRYASALEFAEAIRASVSGLGGPASQSDLARLLFTDFADEMAARDEILKAADDPAPSAIPPAASAAIVKPRPAPPPIPASRSGELGGTKVQPVQAVPSTPVPSMIVSSQEASTKIQLPSPPPPLPPLPPGVIDLSANVPIDSWMANPDTDLLRAHRVKSMVMLVAVVAGLAVVGFAAYYLLYLREPDEPTRVAAPPPVPVDAAPRVVTPVDAGIARDDIIAISRYGFLSISANQKTAIYIDGKFIADVTPDDPISRLPMSPGPKKIKAIGPKGKVKLMNTTILGGQDTDEGTITW